MTNNKKMILASCHILDIHSQGENEKKAKDNLSEAVYLFIASCYERGTLTEVLEECGLLKLKREKMNINYKDKLKEHCEEFLERYKELIKKYNLCYVSGFDGMYLEFIEREDRNDWIEKHIEELENEVYRETNNLDEKTTRILFNRITK